MFVTKKTLKREIEVFESRLDWWRDHYSQLQRELWAQKEAHERLLKHFNLSDTLVKEHNKLETRIK